MSLEEVSEAADDLDVERRCPPIYFEYIVVSRAGRKQDYYPIKRQKKSNFWGYDTRG